MPKKITYKSGEAVMLGDQVELRSFFIFKDRGTVTYIPGLSPFHPDMKSGEIEYVGVKLEGKATGAATIDPATSEVLHLRFLGRGTFNSEDALDPAREIFEDDKPEV